MTEERFKRLFESIPIGLYRTTPDGKISDANQALVEMLGFPSKEALLSMSVVDLYVDSKDREREQRLFGQEDVVRGYEVLLRRLDGNIIWVRDTCRAIRDDRGQVISYEGSLEDMTGQIQAMMLLRESEERYRTLVNNLPLCVYRTTPGVRGKVLMANPAFLTTFGFASQEEILSIDVADLYVRAEERKLFSDNLLSLGKVSGLGLQFKKKDGTHIWGAVTARVIYDEQGEPDYFDCSLEDITGRVQTEMELLRANRALRVLSDFNQKLIRAEEEEALTREICHILVEVGGYRFAWVGYAEQNPQKNVRPVAQDGFEQGYLDRVRIGWSKDEYGRGPMGTAIRTGKTVIVRNTQTDPTFSPWRVEATQRGYASVIALPLIAEGKSFGALLIYASEVDAFDTQEQRLLEELAEDLAYGITMQRARVQHRRSEERIYRQYQFLNALRSIDLTITASLDLRVILDVILEKITDQLRVDAADILAYQPINQTLNYVAGRGLKTGALRHTHLRLGEGHAGRAAFEKKVVMIEDIRNSEPAFEASPELAQEGFITYFGVPLVAKGQVKGILELFNRSKFAPDQEWWGFLETLSGQTAIAIDNAELFDNMQRSNTELSLAYDTTLEGWARALELRDAETQGHSKRVTDMTLRLARIFGIDEREQVHIRRGALLHDIGKMSIPDSILFKAGPLTEDEWKIMRKHPVYAYELLYPIPYLRPALDIPFFHHEKWDGSGYPHGLSGEHIPLAARIFAIVDVWDALSSDRPYRKAWSERKTYEYIQDQAGRHFDPHVAEVFLEIVRG